MITIFEDNKDAALSLFFQKAYPDNIASSFIYANGNGNLIAVAKEYLEKTNDMIGIFLDCVPGNNNIGRIYERLRFLSVQNHYRLLIFPVICTEYYFLDSLVSLGIIKRTNDIELCLSRGLFQNADLMKNGMFKNKTRNFEKYCKNLIIYSGLPCMPEKKYCNIACICKENLPDCPSITVEKKSLNFVSKFPAAPDESKNVDKIKEYHVIDVWEVHNKLIVMFNKMSDLYSQNSDNPNKFFRIRSIK